MLTDVIKAREGATAGVCVRSQSICQSRATSKIPITNWQRAPPSPNSSYANHLITVTTDVTTRAGKGWRATGAGESGAILERPTQAIMAFKCRVTYQFTWLLVTSHNLPTDRCPLAPSLNLLLPILHCLSISHILTHPSTLTSCSRHLLLATTCPLTRRANPRWALGRFVAPLCLPHALLTHMALY